MIDLRKDPVRPNTIYITFIETDSAHRRNGHANELMQVVCDVADYCQIELVLRVEDLPDNECHALMSWYQRLGFGGNRDEMIRVHE